MIFYDIGISFIIKYICIQPITTIANRNGLDMII